MQLIGDDASLNVVGYSVAVRQALQLVKERARQEHTDLCARMDKALRLPPQDVPVGNDAVPLLNLFSRTLTVDGPINAKQLEVRAGAQAYTLDGSFNVTGSSVCLGSANIDLPKNLTYESLLQYWEKKFWLTEFSHLGGNGNPTRSNLVLVTKAARNKPFDLKELKPLNNMKLKDILT